MPTPLHPDRTIGKLAFHPACSIPRVVPRTPDRRRATPMASWSMLYWFIDTSHVRTSTFCPANTFSSLTNSVLRRPYKSTVRGPCRTSCFSNASRASISRSVRISNCSSCVDAFAASSAAVVARVSASTALRRTSLTNCVFLPRSEALAFPDIMPTTNSPAIPRTTKKTLVSSRTNISRLGLCVELIQPLRHAFLSSAYLCVIKYISVATPRTTAIDDAQSHNPRPSIYLSSPGISFSIIEMALSRDEASMRRLNETQRIYILAEIVFCITVVAIIKLHHHQI